jgi:hypothetical protein
MLEGLDRIDWENLGRHVYSSPPQTELPNIIREVLSENPGKREHALEHLFGGGQDIGSIYDTTPYIASFMIEILSEPSTLGKAEILERLCDVAWSPMHYGRGKGTSIHFLRTALRTYDVLEKGIPVYLTLLQSEEDIKVRKWAAELLGAMSDQAEGVVPKLVEAFSSEMNEDVKVALIEAVGRALSETDYRQSDLRNQYAIWFRELVESHFGEDLHIAAAKASIMAARGSLWKDRLGDKDISPRVGEILVDAYLAVENDKYMIEREGIARLLSQLEDKEPILRLLERPEITVDEAQILVRSLLWNIFRPSGDDDQYWQFWTDRHLLYWNPQKMPEATNTYRAYQVYDIVNKHLPWSPHAPSLKRLLTVDKIWEIPTNLFSFFFGLPDSRDELRALIEKSDS